MKTLLATLLFLVSSITVFSQTGPDAAVRAFYKYSNARSSIFSKRHIEQRKLWYTPELYAAFIKQLREDEAYLSQHPTDKPFFGDGLTFRPLDEACESNGKSYNRIQSIGRTESTRTRAVVDVKFAYPKACTAGFEPIVWQVNLRQIGGKWLIDDWTYPEGSTLRGDMRDHKYN